MNQQLIYIADPMCSWCWGFAPVISQIKDTYQESLGFRLVMGGLRPGGGDAWTPGFSDFLRHHWEQVHERSGQEFSFELLDRKEFNYDTEPASRAVRVIRDLAPSEEYNFFKASQKRFYVDNADPNEHDFYRPLVGATKVSWEDFVEKFESDEYKSLVQKDFSQSAQWGVRGFPSLLFYDGNQLFMLSSGYTTYEKVEERLIKIQNG